MLNIISIKLNCGQTKFLSNVNSIKLDISVKRYFDQIRHFDQTIIRPNTILIKLYIDSAEWPAVKASFGSFLH
jgi:hypothetical protein